MNDMGLPSTLNGLDLFSGTGGISLALQPWVRPIAYCENDKYAQAVLLSRMRDGGIATAPIWDDVRTLRYAGLPGIDIVYGGFPCTDISVAGLGKGLDGERSGLYWELHRLVREISPGFVFLENVPAIRTRGLRQVVGSLAELGYDCRWTCLSAEEMGAPHKRLRWFLLAAHPERVKLRNEQGRRGGKVGQGASEPGDDGEKEPVENSDDVQNRSEEQGQDTADKPFDASWWAAEPDVGRVSHGVPFRLDRLKCLGNAVVPACAREAFKMLMGL